MVTNEIIIGVVDGQLVRVLPHGAFFGVFIEGGEEEVPFALGGSPLIARISASIRLRRKIESVEGVVKGEDRARNLLRRWRTLLYLIEESILLDAEGV